MVLKSDSSLLQNRKPFFTPEGVERVIATRCLVARISRLGKGIAPRYASRYWDAIALGIDFRIESTDGTYTVEKWAFDYSLAVGLFETIDKASWADEMTAVLSIDEAIARISRVMTIRQGDMVFVDCAEPPKALIRDEVIQYRYNEQELLYCKIK